MLAFSPQVARTLRASGRRIIVTGAGGWLGKASLEMLHEALGDDLGERVLAYASSARTETLRSGAPIAIRPLSELDHEPSREAYVLHYAYLGKEQVAKLGAGRFISINKEINDRVDRFAEGLKSGGLFFASSGAAHYCGGSEHDPDREPYGAAKVRDEARFLALSRPSVPMVCCRIFNMAGPFMNKLDDYALSCIIRDIQNGGPIRLRASRPVFRSFVHVRDVVDLAVSLMMRGSAPVEPFDTSGSEVVEVGQLALRAAQVLGRPGTPISRPALTGAAEDRYIGREQPFKKLLGELGIVPQSLDAQIEDTAEYLASLPIG